MHSMLLKEINVTYYVLSQFHYLVTQYHFTTDIEVVRVLNVFSFFKPQLSTPITSLLHNQKTFHSPRIFFPG